MFSLIKKDNFYVFLLFFCGLALFGAYLSYPQQLYWDEIIHINGARTILYQNKPYAELTQTPLGREILVLSLQLFGDSPWGGRVMSLVFASINLSLLYLIGLNLFKKQWLAFVLACFLATDSLYYVQARIGMTDQFLLSFLLLSFYSFIKSLDTVPQSKTYLWIGFWLGLAASIKLLSLAFIPIYAFPLLISALHKKESWVNAGKGFVYLVLPFPFILWASYAAIGFSVQEMWEHLVWLWGFLRSFHIDPSITSNVFDWLHLQKPMWYFYDEIDRSHSRFVLLAGNPVFWFAAEFSFLGLLLFAKKIPRRYFYLHAAVIAQFLFWIIKPSTHLYYMLPVLPFYALLIGAFVNFLLERFPDKHKFLVANLCIVLGLNVACFVYYLPILQGKVQKNSVLESYPNLPP